ncbi:MAG: hypothetical protein ACR2PT_16435 [Endozoicomonas sp.]
MNFPMSVLTTCLIAGIIWLGLVMQPTSPPTEFEKYSSATMDYETMSEAGYAMVAYGREAAAEYFDLDGYKALQKAAVSTETAVKVMAEPVSRNVSQPDSTVKTSIVVQKPNSVVESKPETIVGISREIKLAAINDLWQEFSAQTALSKQLKSNNYTVFAVYTDFRRDFSMARVSIGYQDSAMKGERITLPGGEREPLLSAGRHNTSDIVSAWDKIDYSRSVKAVLERRDYRGDEETVAIFVIYQ